MKVWVADIPIGHEVSVYLMKGEDTEKFLEHIREFGRIDEWIDIRPGAPKDEGQSERTFDEYAHREKTVTRWRRESGNA